MTESASASDSARPSAATSAVPPEDLELEEMLEILDAATTLRKERERAHLALEVDETRRLLRERLLETAKVTGERISEAEVDAAIERYFTTLHAHEPPERGLQTALAHLYIRRGRVGAVLGGLTLWVGAIWWLFLSSLGPFSAEGRAARALAKAMEPIEAAHDELPAIALDPAVDALIEQRWDQALELRETGQTSGLESIAEELESLREELLEEYTAYVVSEPGERSGVIRDYTDDTGTVAAGTYLILEALDADDRPVRRRIRDAEKGSSRLVSRWGELVPEEVYARIEADKRADGIVDERLFGEKQRGQRTLDVRMLGTDGLPVPVRRQITEWDD